LIITLHDNGNSYLAEGDRDVLELLLDSEKGYTYRKKPYEKSPTSGPSRK
jgi:hypothetical protein